jgi:CheY-like chemotaxis protein
LENCGAALKRRAFLPMPRTILVIDDNPEVREVVRCMLEGHGFEVLLADNGVDGVEMFSRHHVDAALVDVDMPRMNGLEVCRALRSRAAAVGRNLLLWLMTGVMRPEVEAGAASIGVKAILPKPFTTTELLEQIESDLRAILPAI